MNRIRIGTRDSALALAQTQIVVDAIREYDRSIEIEVVAMKTTGDIILDKTLDKIGGKGLFVKELDKALLDGSVDITVHSMKDMTMDLPSGTKILATGRRDYPCDVIVLPKNKKMDKNLPIGSSSARRNIQIQRLFPDFSIKAIRGNLVTRLEKLDRGEYSALVLAEAGLKRLGLDERIERKFTVEEIIPANCQGIIAVQGRDDFDTRILSKFHCEKSYLQSLCERAFIKALNGGCSAPIATFASLEKNGIILKGMYATEESFEKYKISMDKSEKIDIDVHFAEKEIGNVDFASAIRLGKELAEELKAKV